MQSRWRDTEASVPSQPPAGSRCECKAQEPRGSSAQRSCWGLHREQKSPVSKEKAGARAWLEQGQEAEAAGTRGRVVGKKPGAEVGPNCGGPWDQDGKLSFIWFLGEASEGL